VVKKGTKSPRKLAKTDRFGLIEQALRKQWTALRQPKSFCSTASNK
jgi:hypothetical protein